MWNDWKWRREGGLEADNSLPIQVVSFQICMQNNTILFIKNKIMIPMQAWRGYSALYELVDIHLARIYSSTWCCLLQIIHLIFTQPNPMPAAGFHLFPSFFSFYFLVGSDRFTNPFPSQTNYCLYLLETEKRYPIRG